MAENPPGKDKQDSAGSESDSGGDDPRRPVVKVNKPRKRRASMSEQSMTKKPAGKSSTEQDGADSESEDPSGSVPTKRHQVFRACPACRRVKARCADTRPCPRCVRLDRQQACVVDDASLPRKRRKRSETETWAAPSSSALPLQAITVPGPGQNAWSWNIPPIVPALGDSLDLPKMQYDEHGSEETLALEVVTSRAAIMCDLFEDVALGASSRVAACIEPRWWQRYVAPTIEMGLDPERIVSMFDNLPASLAAIMQEAFEAVEMTTAWHAKQIQSQEALLEGLVPWQSQGLHPDDMLWDSSSEGAFFRVELSPDGQRSNAYASKYFENLYGLPHDVILERLHTGQAHLPFTELEQLGNIIEVRCDVRC